MEIALIVKKLDEKHSKAFMNQTEETFVGVPCIMQIEEGKFSKLQELEQIISENFECLPSELRTKIKNLIDL